MTTFARRQRSPYLANGLDHQGRHPEAAHAATDIGAADDDDALGPATGIIVAVIMSLAAWLVIVLALLSAWWPA